MLVLLWLKACLYKITTTGFIAMTLTLPVLEGYQWAPLHLDCLCGTEWQRKRLKPTDENITIPFDLWGNWGKTSFTWWRWGRWDCRVLGPQHRSARIAAWGGSSRCEGSTRLVSASLPWDREAAGGERLRHSCARSPFQMTKHAWCCLSKQTLWLLPDCRGSRLQVFSLVKPDNQ